MSARAQLRHCNPYPGPRSVIVIDNWRGHLDMRFIDACRDLGVLIEYGVPYAPHKMLHEWCGRDAKAKMQTEGEGWRGREG